MSPKNRPEVFSETVTNSYVIQGIMRALNAPDSNCIANIEFKNTHSLLMPPSARISVCWTSEDNQQCEDYITLNNNGRISWREFRVQAGEPLFPKKKPSDSALQYLKAVVANHIAIKAIISEIVASTGKPGAGRSPPHDHVPMGLLRDTGPAFTELRS